MVSEQAFGCRRSHDASDVLNKVSDFLDGLGERRATMGAKSWNNTFSTKINQVNSDRSYGRWGCSTL